MTSGRETLDTPPGIGGSKGSKPHGLKFNTTGFECVRSKKKKKKKEGVKSIPGLFQLPNDIGHLREQCCLERGAPVTENISNNAPLPIAIPDDVLFLTTSFLRRNVNISENNCGQE